MRMLLHIQGRVVATNRTLIERFAFLRQEGEKLGQTSLEQSIVAVLSWRSLSCRDLFSGSRGCRQLEAARYKKQSGRDSRYSFHSVSLDVKR